MTNVEIIWKYFENKKFNQYAIAGIMGNMKAESNLQPNNLQNTYERSLGMTDEQYTRAVDNGTYTNFIDDSAGYGLVQFTYSGYKKELYEYCKKQNKSIADITCQLDCLYSQISKSGVAAQLNASSSIRQASDIFLTRYERPKDQSESVQITRAKYAQEFYDQFAKKTTMEGGSGMKYSDNNKPMVCMMTNSTCYKSTRKMQVKGILWHCTGANNPWLKRYVQPDDNASNKDELLEILGKNPYRNDWNHSSVEAGLNAWIGKLANGDVASVQVMPWDYRPWGCGGGPKGTCNDGWIQFEICEDSLSDINYFNKAYREACELTAYLCKMFKLNPKGNSVLNGVSVPVILCHQDSYRLGLGSNHSDIYNWFNRYGKTMDNVRSDVAALMGNSAIAPATPVQPTTNPNFLGEGDSGAEVKKLQENLLKLGYKLPKWGADGDFGQETLDAVLKFQEDNKLEIDGIVGPATQAAIKVALEKLSTPTSPTPTNTIYRVRKEWTNASSQIGAFSVLENAINACKKAGSTYKVFDSTGKVVYPTDSTPIQTPPKEEEPVVIPPAVTYSGVMLGSSSKDERGEYRGGQAGDQTGKEVWILGWYDGGWTHVIRPKTAALAEKIAVACEKACNNSNIGYDQYQRNTLLAEAKKVGLDMSKITTPCECDCSSFVSTCCVCAGLSEGIFFAGGNGRTTYNLMAACQQTDQFTILATTNYTKSKDYLKRGDILLSSGHTVIVLSNGSKANQIAPITVVNETYKVKITTNLLNVRLQPDINSSINGQVKKNDVFTIIEEREGWGKLKSGAGWINLDYTQRI